MPSLHVELRETGIKLEMQIPEHLTIETHPSLLKIVLENVIENAIRFRNPEAPTLTIKAKVVEESVQILVQDNGIGIEPEYINRVTDMFFRGSAQSQGNGLGLYIVKKAIEKLNGRFHFASTYAQGSTVTIVLPFALETS